MRGCTFKHFRLSIPLRFCVCSFGNRYSMNPVLYSQTGIRVMRETLKEYCAFYNVRWENLTVTLLSQCSWPEFTTPSCLENFMSHHISFLGFIWPFDAQSEIFWFFGQNPKLWLFIGKLLNSTLLWCCLLTLWLPEWNLAWYKVFSLLTLWTQP